jgi:hypothetical protein
MAGTKISVPEISVQYVGLPLCKIAYSMCDIPCGLSEICGETCRAAGDTMEGGCIVNISGGSLASVFMIQELVDRKMVYDFLGRKSGLGCSVSKWDLVTLGPPVFLAQHTLPP